MTHQRGRRDPVLQKPGELRDRHGRPYGLGDLVCVQVASDGRRGDVAVHGYVCGWMRADTLQAVLALTAPVKVAGIGGVPRHFAVGDPLAVNPPPVHDEMVWVEKLVPGSATAPAGDLRGDSAAEDPEGSRTYDMFGGGTVLWPPANTSGAAGLRLVLALLPARRIVGIDLTARRPVRRGQAPEAVSARSHLSRPV